MPEIISGLVSTIIPSYNRPEMLREAVESALAQSYRPIEVIISDDGSSSDAREVAAALQSAHPDIVRVLFNPNRGAGKAREAGRQLARGEFIQYLDSDDLLWPRKFEIQTKALRENPHCGAAYGWIRLCMKGEPPSTTPHKWSGRKLETLFPYLLVDRWWNTDAPLWRRSVCDQIGPWSELRYSQDWEYDARAGALGTRLAYCPEFVCDQRQHPGSRQTGHGGWLAPPDQVRFFATLHASACKAGVQNSEPEMQHFSRWVFAQARKSGALGDTESAEALFRLALEATPSPDLKMRLVGVAASIVGWKITGSMSQFRDRFAGGNSGPLTQKQSWMVTGE